VRHPIVTSPPIVELPQPLQEQVVRGKLFTIFRLPIILKHKAIAGPTDVRPAFFVRGEETFAAAHAADYLAILFAAMFASVFMPGQKIFLHIVAGMALIAAVWEAWRTFHATPEILYTPVIVLWAVYYALSLRRA
jgi:hypothetical protein